MGLGLALSKNRHWRKALLHKAKRYSCYNICVPKEDLPFAPREKGTHLRAIPFAQVAESYYPEESMAESIQLSTQEAEAAYKEMLPLAMSLEPTQLEPYQGSIEIARRNLIRGSEAIQKLEEKLKEEVKPERLEAARQTTKLCLAAEFAVLCIENMERRTGAVGVLPLLVAARLIRRRLLKNAEGAAEYTLVPKERVENIKKGKGPLDTARDCIALAALYRECKESLSGKTPVSGEDIDRCSQLGTQLLGLLKPEKAIEIEEAPEEIAAAYQVRDRFWTLLVQQRELLWKLAGLVVGPREVNEVVPPLLSQEREKTPQTPEVKQARQEAKDAKEKAKQAEQEAKEKAKTAEQISKEARKKKASTPA